MGGGECVRVGFGVVFENRSFFMLGFVGTFLLLLLGPSYSLKETT